MYYSKIALRQSLEYAPMLTGFEILIVLLAFILFAYRAYDMVKRAISSGEMLSMKLGKVVIFFELYMGRTALWLASIMCGLNLLKLADATGQSSVLRQPLTVLGSGDIFMLITPIILGGIAYALCLTSEAIGKMNNAEQNVDPNA